MPLSCAEATSQYLASLSEDFRCVPAGNRLRIVTPYPYPDNDYIEVFVEELPGDRARVSDLGETTRRLYAMGLDVFASKKRAEMVHTIAAGRDVMVSRGQLVREGHTSDVGELMFDVIVTARGVADMILTSRAYEAATFTEEVAQLFDERAISYEPRPKLRGETGRVYTVDFRFPESGSYIQTLSPSQPGGIQNVLNRVHRIWSDVNGHVGARRKVSLLNDVDFRWQEQDIALLSRVSNVQYWTRPEELLAAVTS